MVTAPMQLADLIDQMIDLIGKTGNSLLTLPDMAIQQSSAVACSAISLRVTTRRFSSESAIARSDLSDMAVIVMDGPLQPPRPMVRVVLLT